MKRKKRIPKAVKDLYSQAAIKERTDKSSVGRNFAIYKMSVIREVCGEFGCDVNELMLCGYDTRGVER